MGHAQESLPHLQDCRINDVIVTVPPGSIHHCDAKRIIKKCRDLIDLFYPSMSHLKI